MSIILLVILIWLLFGSITRYAVEYQDKIQWNRDCHYDSSWPIKIVLGGVVSFVAMCMGLWSRIFR